MEAGEWLSEMTPEPVTTLRPDFGYCSLAVGRRAFGGPSRWHDGRDQPMVGEPTFHSRPGSTLARDTVRGRTGGDAADDIPLFHAGFVERARRGRWNFNRNGHSGPPGRRGRRSGATGHRQSPHRAIGLVSSTEASLNRAPSESARLANVVNSFTIVTRGLASVVNENSSPFLRASLRHPSLNLRNPPEFVLETCV